MPTLACKYTTHIFARYHAAALEQSELDAPALDRTKTEPDLMGGEHMHLNPSKPHYSRPLWARKRKRSTGLHAFQSTCRKMSLTQMRTEWNLLSPDQRAAYSEQARLLNKEHAAVNRSKYDTEMHKHSEDAMTSVGPWGFGDSQFPLAAARLRASGYGTEPRFVEDLAEAWTLEETWDEKVPACHPHDRKCCADYGPHC
eukprot:2915928-Amphidinium_carterae.1